MSIITSSLEVNQVVHVFTHQKIGYKGCDLISLDPMLAWF